MIRYVIYVDQEKAQEGDLAPGEHIAGRSRSADIHLAQPDISGKHLKLEVSETAVFAENLSSHGTLCNGAALEARTELHDGDRLALGKHLVFEISCGGAAAEPATESAATEAPATEAPATAVPPEGSAAAGSDPGKTQIPGPAEVSAPPEDDPDKTLIPGMAPAVPASSPADADPDKTLIPGASPVPEAAAPQKAGPADAAPEKEESDVQKTDIMHTRLASLEEMDHLRHVDRKRSTGKTLKYLLVALAAVVALALLYSLKTAPKEASLSWPVDADGHELGAFYDPGNGGHKAGAFSLAYPNIKGQTSVSTEKGGTVFISTRCGRDASVPLRIMFVAKRSEAFLTMDRKAVLSGMLADLQKDNRRWNMAQISDVFFIGADNGLPCLSVEYRREADKQSWYGEILFFRTGDRAYMRLAEIPAAERGRGQNFVSNIPFLKFAPQYMQSHWEGNPEYHYESDPAVMMDEISKHLSKQAPFEWARTYLLLQNTLMESIRRHDAPLGKNALGQLRRLRDMQSVWYNSQKIQYNTARLNNDRHQENAVMELCKTVFSSPDDLRYFILRRNLWE